MAKLYWRIKKNGKWTWTPAIIAFCDEHLVSVKNLVDPSSQSNLLDFDSEHTGTPPDVNGASAPKKKTKEARRAEARLRAELNESIQAWRDDQ